MSCTAPLSDEQLVAYWADDVGAAERDAIEEHLFACEDCAAAAGRIARIAQALRTSLPPVISVEQLEDLRRQGLSLVESSFQAWQRQEVTFAPGVDVMIHHLGGLDLATAERVDVTVWSESNGNIMFEEPFAPFDRERGEVLIACQRHFASFPRDVVFDVRVHRGAGLPEVRTYIVPHVFA
jgi:hypothetical protein